MKAGPKVCWFIACFDLPLFLWILRYTFGKPVLGNARVNLDIVGMNGTTFPFARPVITVSWIEESCSVGVENLTPAEIPQQFPFISKLVIQNDGWDLLVPIQLPETPEREVVYKLKITESNI